MGQCYNITFHPLPFLFYNKGRQLNLIKTIFLDTTKPLKSPTDTATSRLQATKYPTNKMSNLYKPKTNLHTTPQKHSTDTVGQRL
jgi:hypothetical protein